MSFVRQLNAGDLTVFDDMTHKELVSIIVQLNNKRKDAEARVVRLHRSKRELMWKLGYHTWDELLENLT